ncbi:MAG: ABC transporter substrate-binding protein [Candidatus Poribacteria bacterium]
MKKLNIVFVLTICFSLILYACGKKLEKKETIPYTDFVGRQVNIPKTVQRIVSMAPNVTEMLFAIGLDNEIVGVTEFCNYPESAKDKAKIGGYYNPNIEVILSLKPDLIVATPDGYSKERIEKLNKSGIPIFIVNPQKIDDVLDSMLVLGKITGKEEYSKQVVDSLKNRVKVIRDKVSKIPISKRPKVFYEIGQDPLVTVGPGNFVNDLIKTAGGINIAEDAPNSWPIYSVEAIITKNPDIILTAPPTMTSSDKNEFERWNKYRTISAVINNRIYAVDPDILLRSGPRIFDGLEKLYSLFHQEK